MSRTVLSNFVTLTDLSGYLVVIPQPHQPAGVPQFHLRFPQAPLESREPPVGVAAPRGVPKGIKVD